MRAVAVPDFGARPEVMQLSVPGPGPGEILLRIHAAGMNPFDWKVIDNGAANVEALAARGIRAINFSNITSAELLATLADTA